MAAVKFLLVASAMALTVAPTSAALEGLYILTAPEGQLMKLNWTSGERVPVGKPLSAAGLRLQDCVPTAIDPTGKWIYTLATPTNSSSQQLELVAMQLGDGTLHPSKAPLSPATFPNMSRACAFTLASDGGWNAYVSAQVGSRLRTVLLSVEQWPGKEPPPPEVILDVPLDELGLGGSLSIPASTIDGDTVLWITLEHGVAGLSLANKTIDRSVMVPKGKTLTAVQGYGTMYALLSDTDGTVLASFSDDGPTPDLHSGSIHINGIVAHNQTSFAFLSDKGACVFMTTDGNLVTIDLTGKPLGTTHACVQGHGCPAGMAYEPFVF